LALLDPPPAGRWGLFGPPTRSKTLKNLNPLGYGDFSQAGATPKEVSEDFGSGPLSALHTHPTGFTE